MGSNPTSSALFSCEPAGVEAQIRLALKRALPNVEVRDLERLSGGEGNVCYRVATQGPTTQSPVVVLRLYRRGVGARRNRCGEK